MYEVCTPLLLIQNIKPDDPVPICNTQISSSSQNEVIKNEPANTQSSSSSTQPFSLTQELNDLIDNRLDSLKNEGMTQEVNDFIDNQYQSQGNESQDSNPFGNLDSTPSMQTIQSELEELIDLNSQEDLDIYLQEALLKSCDAQP